MNKSKKLTDKQLGLLRPRFQVGEANPIGMLLDHIDAMDVEFDELVRTSDALIDEQSKRIKELEKAFRRVSEIVSYRYGEDENEDSDELNRCFEVLNANESE